MAYCSISDKSCWPSKVAAASVNLDSWISSAVIWQGKKLQYYTAQYMNLHEEDYKGSCAPAHAEPVSWMRMMDDDGVIWYVFLISSFVSKLQQSPAEPSFHL